MRGLYGYTGAATATAQGVNAFGRHSATPYLICDAHPGGTAVYVSLVLLTRAEQEPPRPEVEVNGDVVALKLSGGESITVRLDGVPAVFAPPSSGTSPVRTSGFRVESW
jgi:hypothetical protein